MISELPGVNTDVVAVLKENGIEDIEQFMAAFDDKSVFEIEDLAKEEIEEVANLIQEVVEFVDEEPEDESEGAGDQDGADEEPEDEEYFCPECGAKITIDMTECPNCGIGLSFEEEDEE